MHKSDQTETGRLCARMTDRLRLAHAALNQVTEALAEPDSDMEEGLLAVERHSANCAKNWRIKQPRRSTATLRRGKRSEPSSRDVHRW